MLAGQIGYLSIIFSFIFSFLLFFFIINNYKNQNKIINKYIYQFSFLQLLLIVISFFTLVLSFINSDFSLNVVYQNSHTTKPLFYKISGTWGNHEGSLLLWLLVLSIFSFIFLIKSKKNPKKYRLLTIFFQNIIFIGFLIFIIQTSNPFLKLYPAPLEGLGLNPILQDPALAIHPPILYVGYVGSSIIFSSALAAMIEKFVNKTWANSLKIWTLLSWAFLTLGIMLGSIWAYYELGWGGFWFWDPVENVSLMPWLALTALVHSLIILEKRNIFHSWTLVLAIISFTLSMNGTFLVRSGILNSVHTFANDPERGLYILTFLFILIFLSLIIFYIFQPKKTVKKNFFIFSREVGISINNWFMMFFLTVVFIGTIYPIILDVLKDIRISVGSPFFTITMLPLLIPFLVFMTIGPKMNWINTKFNILLKELIYPFLISLILVSIIYLYFDETKLFGYLIFLFGLFLLITLVKDVLLFFKKKQKINFPKIISHFGFGLLVVSISLNSIFSVEKDINLKIGESYKFDKYELKFKNISERIDKNYTSVIGNFELLNKNGKSFILNPEIRIFNQPKILTSEASIKTNFLHDKFLVMAFIENSEFYNIRFQYKPLMIWIWISALLMSCGGFIRVIQKRI